LFFSIPARPHTAKVFVYFLAFNEMKKAHHPPHAPDLAPSDFSFGHVKRNLMGYRAENSSELPVRIRVILKAIQGVESFKP
jgi:hypothetical protein